MLLDFLLDMVQSSRKQTNNKERKKTSMHMAHAK